MEGVALKRHREIWVEFCKMSESKGTEMSQESKGCGTEGAAATAQMELTGWQGKGGESPGQACAPIGLQEATSDLSEGGG